MSKSPPLLLGVGRLRRKECETSYSNTGQGMKGAGVQMGAKALSGCRGERQFCREVLERHPLGIQTAWVLDLWVRFQQAETSGNSTIGSITCEQKHRALQIQSHIQGISSTRDSWNEA